MTPEEVKALRKKLLLTAQAFGNAVGLKGKHAGRTVRRWECGDVNPSGPVKKNMKLLEDQNHE